MSQEARQQAREAIDAIKAVTEALRQLCEASVRARKRLRPKKRLRR